MYEDRVVSVMQTVCICDRCGLEMRREDVEGEWDEYVSLVFRGGYHSVFGDGSLVELELCQHCVRDLLGPWLRVTPDDPAEPQHKPVCEHKRAFQASQLQRDFRQNLLFVECLSRQYGLR